MAAKKFLRNVAGKITEIVATVISTGAANDGDIPALDSTGRLDVSVLPVGVGPDVKVVLASEALVAGDYVNIYNNGGTPNVRKADNSNSREAHGFVKTAVSNGANATVYFEGPNDALSSLTVGARYFLNTAGAVTTTAPSAPAAQISQLVGIAVDATTINTDIDDVIVLA